MLTWRRPVEGEYIQYQWNYIKRVPDGDLIEHLKAQTESVIARCSKLTEEEINCRYAEGKWSVLEVLQHVIDTERILCYRALRFARKDNTPLPGFDENSYVDNADTHHRNLREVLADYTAMRSATIHLFTSFTQEMLEQKGVANSGTITVNTFAYFITGHELHHWHILEERYGIK